MNKKNQKKLINKVQTLATITILGYSLLFYPASTLLANSKLEETRKNLDQELTKINDLNKSKKETDVQVRTLSKEIDSLDKEMDSAQKSLENTNKDIELIQDELGETRKYISTLEQTIRAQKTLIREYVSSLYVQKDVSLFEVVLSQDQLSDLLGSVQKTGVMQDSITESITLISAKEKEIVSEKKHLFDKEEELMNLKQSQEKQKSLLQQTQEDKETLLTQTKGQQSEYEALLKQSFTTKQNLLNSIKVLGGSDGRPGAISLEEAYSLATANSARLGNKIRPEYLVGVMKIESGLGGNVGRSFYKDSLSGCAARDGNTTKLNFAREEQSFEKITSDLGVPLTQPVSGCPYPKYIGTGGAMGPAQIMPATWLGYEAKLKSLKGTAVNPWSMEDAMLAMGMVLLGKVGDQSIAGNDELERKAALCYLGGCNVKNMWYAESVLREALRTKELLGK
jgi:peptidoglycan hydrolase CwlO-like protein